MSIARNRGRSRALLGALGSLALAGMVDVAAAVEFKPEGKLQLDYAAHDDDRTRLSDGLAVRRARLGLGIEFNPQWSFEVVREFSDDGDIAAWRDGAWKTVALAYRGQAVELSVGQTKLPFSLANAESSSDTLLAERALPVEALAFSRRMGVCIDRRRERYTASLMAFGNSIGAGHRGRGVAARLTYAPLLDAHHVLHAGVSAAVEHPRGKVDLDAPPESRVAGVDLVNTGGIAGVDRIDRAGLEAAWQAGPLLLQGEWLRATLRRDAPWANATLAGGYVEGGWVLTGETRRYKHGRFKGVRPQHAGGAWELTARYSRLDLDDRDVRGGRERNLALGVNYYPHQQVRISANYISVHSTRRGKGDDPRIVMLRAQFEF